MQPVEDSDNKGGGSVIGLIIGLIIGLALIIYVLSVILG